MKIYSLKHFKTSLITEIQVLKSFIQMKRLSLEDLKSQNPEEVLRDRQRIREAYFPQWGFFRIGFTRWLGGGILNLSMYERYLSTIFGSNKVDPESTPVV